MGGYPVLTASLIGDLVMDTHEISLPLDNPELEREAPPGVLDLMALYESLEKIEVISI